MERYLGERYYPDVLGAKNENEVRMRARVRPKFTRALERMQHVKQNKIKYINK